MRKRGSKIFTSARWSVSLTLVKLQELIFRKRATTTAAAAAAAALCGLAPLDLLFLFRRGNLQSPDWEYVR